MVSGGKGFSENPNSEVERTLQSKKRRLTRIEDEDGVEDGDDVGDEDGDKDDDEDDDEDGDEDGDEEGDDVGDEEGEDSDEDAIRYTLPSQSIEASTQEPAKLEEPVEAVVTKKVLSRLGRDRSFYDLQSNVKKLM